jgi:hypothetical protein
MNPIQEMVFLSEIVLQSKIALRAGERLQAADNNLDRVDVWSTIQTILIAAGNISRILWPGNKKYGERGENLRKLLNIESENLLSDRRFRNHFEHYDERVEDWYTNTPSAVYTDLAMNPDLYGTSYTKSYHRGYNTYNNTLVFRDETLDLAALLNAIKRIQESCKPYAIV